MIELKGMTWNHPRGYDPLVATSAEYSRRNPGVQIQWDRRSLQDFGDVGAEELALTYDFMVIDHPHVGEFAEGGTVLPLDGLGRDAELQELLQQTVGNSQQSYVYEKRHWALAIDAAAHVSAYRSDLLASPPTTWESVQSLAREGRVIWPLKPIDSLMSFFSLCGNLGLPCATQPGILVDRSHGTRVLTFMREFMDCLPRECLSISPPEALDRLSGSDRYAYCPLLFGYSNYARPGFRSRLVSFANVPLSDRNKPEGSILGGTGLAISNRCRSIDVALDYAFWIASGECQREHYCRSGGQPAHIAAWDDTHANACCTGFFQNTRATLESSWIRPRFAGYVQFQTGASTIVHNCLTGRRSVAQAMDELLALFQSSFAARSRT